MAYNTEDLRIKALKAVKTHKLVFIEDVVSFMPCGRATFYNHELDELDDLKEELEKNRIDLKRELRAKWFESDSPVLQIALMKLIGTPEECQRLNNSRLALDVNTNTVQQEMPLFFKEGTMDLNKLSARSRAEFDDLLLPK